MNSESPNDLPVTYCERWNDTLKKPIDPLSVDEAAARYESGELFCVVIGELTRPVALIEVRWETDYAAVWFFDNQVRRTTSYTFTRVDTDRLFLSGITAWTFTDEAHGRLRDAWRIEHITYRQDGVVHREVKDKTTGETVTEDLSDVDVVAHWQAVPEFGEWEGLAERERVAEQLNRSGEQ
ncbi:hypothetical protein DMH04_25565 [Kibdelosporangium aridum]|uniref:Uncharacterized protein n=1 Tax=Kibdelosporangium aridum TaxID=2030 RepID=A0A428Z688_KIBAR|nr:hypothetical protein [Kibdelosporangium aridum]RSM82563.1 hypothetical protein DMH04_25565 [Kibdelosporangium aridum]